MIDFEIFFPTIFYLRKTKSRFSEPVLKLVKYIVTWNNWYEKYSTVHRFRSARDYGRQKNKVVCARIDIAQMIPTSAVSSYVFIFILNCANDRRSNIFIKFKIRYWKSANNVNKTFQRRFCNSKKTTDVRSFSTDMFRIQINNKLFFEFR